MTIRTKPSRVEGKMASFSTIDIIIKEINGDKNTKFETVAVLGAHFKALSHKMKVIPISKIPK